MEVGTKEMLNTQAWVITLVRIIRRHLRSQDHIQMTHGVIAGGLMK